MPYFHILLSLSTASVDSYTRRAELLITKSDETILYYVSVKKETDILVYASQFPSMIMNSINNSGQALSGASREVKLLSSYQPWCDLAYCLEGC